MTALLGMPSAFAASSSVTVEGAWVREGPPVAQTLAGYMTLNNESTEPVSIHAVRSTDFERVEFHRSMITGGMATMKMEARIEIPARGRIVFKPAGRHVMLIGPAKAFKSGDVIRFVLMLRNGEEIPVLAPVRREPLE